MEKKSVNAHLQDHVRKTLRRIQELEKGEVDLKIQGRDSRRLSALRAAYRQLLNVCFDLFEWEDPG